MKLSRLLPLLIAPLLLVSCSDKELINSSEIHKWIDKDIDVFKTLNARDDKDQLIVMPYSEDLFVTYETITVNEDNPDAEIKTYESNYELSFEFNNNKVMLNINNNEENKFENIDNYFQLVKDSEGWIVDEERSDASKHDYYAYQELAFDSSIYPYGQEKGETHLNLNVYQNDTQMVVAFWKENTLEFTSWPETMINSYFNLPIDKELTNFVKLTGPVTSIKASEAIVASYPVIDLEIETNNSNAIKDYIKEMEAKSYQKEDYHPYKDSKDCYFINQEYEFKEPGKKDPTLVLQSLNVYLDRSIGSDKKFNIRLEVQEDSETA